MKRNQETEERIISYLVQQLRGQYNQSPNRAGHDFTHIERAMKFVVKICEGTKTSPFIAQLAALFHDLHRVLQIDDNSIKKFIRNKLSLYPVTEKEIESIVEAVLEHSKLNDPKDSELTCVLKDADHLDGAGAIGITRICQHRHYLPPYNPSNPFHHGSSKEEDLRNLVDDFHRVLEWEEMLRLPKAIELGKSRFAFLREFLEVMKQELKETNAAKEV